MAAQLVIPRVSFCLFIPKSTTQWPPEVRGTEVLPGGSSVRALPALLRFSGSGRPLHSPCTKIGGRQYHLCVPDSQGQPQASMHLAFISCLLGPCCARGNGVRAREGGPGCWLCRENPEHCISLSAEQGSTTLTASLALSAWHWLGRWGG